MGVKFHEIYADQSENKNESFRLALEGDYTKIRQESLNPMALRFQEEVKEKRISSYEPAYITEVRILVNPADMEAVEENR